MSSTRQAPNIIRMTPEWFKTLQTTQASRDGENYYPARPLGFDTIGARAKAAWMVFTGKADALVWPPHNSPKSRPE